MKIAIDAGHGLNTLGKRCLKSIDPKQTREWVLNDRIADYLTEYLKGYECTVKRVDDVTGKKDISLSNRCKTANNWGADFYLSIHHNAGINGGTGGGVVIYTYTKTSAATNKKRDIIYNEVIAQNKLRGNRSDPTLTANFYVVKNTKMPAVLIECGFMDSKTDTPQILTDDFAKKTAKGLCNGLVKALNLKAVKKPEKEPVKETVKTEEKGMDIKKYETMNDIPEYWQDAVQWALNSKILLGTGDGKLGLTEQDIKAIVFIYRYHKSVVPSLMGIEIN